MHMLHGGSFDKTKTFSKVHLAFLYENNCNKTISCSILPFVYVVCAVYSASLFESDL